MDKASEALADVRGWLCDNLSEGDAGKVCGMLSVVSRHISAIERENAELRQERDLYRELFHLTTQPDTYMQVRDENAKLQDENARLRSCLSDDAENARQIMGENTKLRELIQKIWKWERNGCYVCPLEEDCKVLCVYDGDCGVAVEIEKELQELGIEVDDDD